jgi:hypothetical protein
MEMEMVRTSGQALGGDVGAAEEDFPLKGGGQQKLWFAGNSKLDRVVSRAQDDNRRSTREPRRPLPFGSRHSTARLVAVPTKNRNATANEARASHSPAPQKENPD